MFKTILALILGGVWIMPAAAQVVGQSGAVKAEVEEAQPPHLPEMPLEKKFFPELRYPPTDWVKKLHLNDMQVQQWQKIRAESAPKRKELMQKIQYLHREIADLQKADEEKLKLLLNENQLNKYNRQQERLEKMRKRNMPREPKKSLSKKMKTFP